MPPPNSVLVIRDPAALVTQALAEGYILALEEACILVRVGASTLVQAEVCTLAPAEGFITGQVEACILAPVEELRLCHKITALTFY